MYIGQIGTNSWLKSSWLNSAGFKSNGIEMANTLLQAKTQKTQTQPKTRNMDSVEISDAYMRFSNRLQILETPEANQVEANLNLTTELLPDSEKNQYTEEDALMNQYMKQYRLNFIKDGDSFVLDTSKPVKLMLEGQVSQESLDEFRAQLEKNGLGDEIDLRGVQEDFIHMDIRFDNAESFKTKVDYLASRYAVLKDRIQNQYSGEKLEQEMQTLDTIYTNAKEEMANSYANNIGGFYEGLGQSGVAEDMRESVLATIDRKADEYTSYLAENDIYAVITDPNQQWLKQDDGYMAARLRESVASSSVNEPTTQTVSNQTPYSTNDLAFSAIYAKGLSKQIKNPDWNTYEIKESDAEIGKYLAKQYQSLTDEMEEANISNKLSDLLKDSFEPFIDKFLDALDKKIDYNRERVSKKSWLTGFIRTEYINRNEVYQAFAMFK